MPVTVQALLAAEFERALILFATAGATDALDGALARLLRARSRLGQWLDPLADKLLLVSTFGMLAWMGLLPVWLAVLALGRDLLLMLAASFLTRRHRGFDIAPLRISKLNTAAQVLLVVWLLASLVWGLEWPPVDQALFGLVTITLLASTLAYALAGTGQRRPGEDA